MTDALRHLHCGGVFKRLETDAEFLVRLGWTGTNWMRRRVVDDHARTVENLDELAWRERKTQRRIVEDVTRAGRGGS